LITSRISSALFLVEYIKGFKRYLFRGALLRCGPIKMNCTKQD